MKKIFFTFFLLFLSCSMAKAAPLAGGTDFGFTSDGGALESDGDPANTADGNTANGGFNDHTIGVRYSMPASGKTDVHLQDLPITFTYTFNDVYDVFGFTIYNGWDCCGQAINDFTLSFYDTAGDLIGSSYSNKGTSAESKQDFLFGFTYLDVKSMELMVTSVYEDELEFREISFNPVTVTKPSTPTLSSPTNGSTDVTLTPTLITNSFSDPDVGDIHLQTDWQISTSSDFSSSVLYETSTSNLTSLTVPASVLQGSTTYYWRVKFYDNRGTESYWSSAYSFTTEQAFTDTNENGIPDNLENDTADLNNDGTADIKQTDEIKTLNTVVGEGQIGLSIKESTTVTKTVEINSIDPDSISKYQRPHTMPLGMLSFKLNVTNPGDTAYVKMYFSEAAPEDASWFFHDSINGWADYSQYATFSEDRKSASIKLKDGDYGDSDGVENGVIVDPCGFGIASWLKGKITDSATSVGLSKGVINFSDIDLTLNTMSDGSYLSMLIPGTYDMDVTLSNYITESLSDVEILEAEILTKNVKLSGRCKITGIEITGTPSTNNPLAIKVNAKSGSETINYRYSIHDGYGTPAYDGTNWQLMGTQEYQTENSCNYTFATSGKSIVVVWATSSGTDSVIPNGIPIIGWSADTSQSGCTINFTGVTITGEQKVNEKMTFAVNAESPCDNIQYYRFSVHPYYGTDDYDGTHWKSLTTAEWTSSNSIDYSFTEAGKYIIVVWVTDETSNVDPNGIPIIGWSVDIE